MRIHTDTLDMKDIRSAMPIDVSATRLTEHGSRSHARAFDVILTGSSSRMQNGGREPAATWDEWGVFLGNVFAAEHDVKTPYYADGSDFDRKTAGRFSEGASGRVPMPGDTHLLHTWSFDGQSMACTKCTARQVR